MERRMERRMMLKRWITGSRAKEECEASTVWGRTWYTSRMGSSRVPSITRATSTCRDCELGKLRATSISSSRFAQVRPPGFAPSFLAFSMGTLTPPRRGAAPELQKRPSHQITTFSFSSALLPSLPINQTIPALRVPLPSGKTKKRRVFKLNLPACY